MFARPHRSLFLLGLLASVNSACAENWPAWRGPRGDGTSSETHVPVHWSATTNVVWKTRIPGDGHASPIVWDDRIFLTTAIAFGDALPPRRSTAPGNHDNLPVTHRHKFAALAVSQLKVAKDIEELRTTLKTTQENLTTSQTAEAKARKEAKQQTEAADKAKKELETAKTDLAAASEKADQQEKRANELAARLDKTTLERNDSQAEVARWRASGLTLEQIKATLADNKRLVSENDALNKENRVLGRTLTQKQSELDILTGTKTKVDLPATLKGKVIAVDPKYEFVVLNIGLDDGVLARGEMLVNRSGKLVAKVRILTAEPHRSVANVLPDWKQGEIMEGDIVLVGL